MITVSTHDGFFHADEVFALAVISLWAKKMGEEIKIIRSRDKAIYEKAQMVVDIGGVNDPATNHFDHHQPGGAGKRENGIPYAAVGLVWRHFGEKITSKEAAERVEKKLVMPIDAIDNGVSLSTSVFAGISDYSIVNAIWILGEFDENGGNDRAFWIALDFASRILAGEIKKAELVIEGERIVGAEIVAQGEPRILVLPVYYPWGKAVGRYKKIMWVVFPNKGDSRWCVQAASDDSGEFGKDRISFPASWRGLMDEELAEESGVVGALFCHKGGYFATAATKGAALAMAQKALNFFERK